MKSIDTGKDKVKKICEVLTKETLDPAKEEAKKIVGKAHVEAEKIVSEGKREAQRLLGEIKKKIQEERNVFQASINLACKKSLDTLRQEIEQSLFNTELNTFVEGKMQDPHVIAEIIAAIIKGIEKEGIDANLRAIIPGVVSAKAVNQELAKGILERLKSNSVEVGDIEGGALVKIMDKNLTIDMTDEALKTLLASFVREDFRSVIFETDL